VFTINPLGQSGSYRASDMLLAGYLMADHGLTSAIRLVGGARVEASRVKVVSQDLFRNELPVSKDFVDVLPSLGLNIALGETQQLRLSAARTVARPEYRELSPILNRDVLGGQGFRGDTTLVRSTIDNFDVRWEWYPNDGELVSVALFAKHHTKPIEKIEVPTSGTSVLSYINAQSADNYGVELEIRKELGYVAEFLTPFLVFSNVTLMTSEVRLGVNNSSSSTNPNRPLAGQAPYIINAGLTYASYDGSVSATALFNRVGKQIAAAGPAPLPDMYEMPRNALDLSLRLPFFAGMDAKVDARNLFDSRVELRQGAVSRLSYTTGRVFSFGLNWKR
jgi:TonB-dependent receptor